MTESRPGDRAHDAAPGVLARGRTRREASDPWMLALQAAAGNRAVVELLAARPTAQRQHDGDEGGHGQAAGAGAAPGSTAGHDGTAGDGAPMAQPAWVQWDQTVTRPLNVVLRSLRPNHPDFHGALERLDAIQLAIDASDLIRDDSARERAAIVLESVLALRQAVETRTGRTDRQDPEFMLNAAHERATRVVELARGAGAEWSGREAWDREVRIPLEDARSRVPDWAGDRPVDLEEAALYAQDALEAAVRLIGTVPGGEARLVAGQTYRAIIGARAAIAGGSGGHVGHDSIVQLAELAYSDAVRLGSRASLAAARAAGPSAPPATAGGQRGPPPGR